jgi:hypothetical protein
MNSRKTSGAPGKHQDLAPDNSLEVLCGNHAGPHAGGEKPHLYCHGGTWFCVSGTPWCRVETFGGSVQVAYENWAEEVDSEPYWLCCGARAALHPGTCNEARVGNLEHCRFGTRVQHSKWSKAQ